MSNQWVNYVKKYADTYHVPYKEAMQMPEVKAGYAELRNVSPAHVYMGPQRIRQSQNMGGRRKSGSKTRSGSKSRRSNSKRGGQNGHELAYGNTNYFSRYGGLVVGGSKSNRRNKDNEKYYRIGQELGNIFGGANNKEKGLLTSLLSGLNANISID
jgi:hypothetical protein